MESQRLPTSAGLRLATLLAGLALAVSWVSPAAAVTPSGKVIAWGSNSLHEGEVPASASKDIIEVSAGYDWGLALTQGGKVVAWGFNGLGQTAVPVIPVAVNEISAGYGHGLALRADGKITAWGYNNWGQTNVPVLPSGWSYWAVSAGQTHSLAVRHGSTGNYVTTWGDNTYGECVMPVSNDIRSVAAGDDFSLALRNTGTVLAWGRHDKGQTSIPPGLTSVVAIAAGASHALALKSDGTVVAWGYDNHGQTDVPPGLSNVTAISAGGDLSMALKSDRTVVAWGYDNHGQTDVPPGTHDIVSIDAGATHALAVMQLTAPAPPTAVSAVPGSGAATVSWHAPADDGNSPIVAYTVTSSPGSKTCATAGALSCTVSGLTNGTSYTFSVTAKNAIGTSVPSLASAAVTPFATPAPTAEPPAPTAEPPATPEETATAQASAEATSSETASEAASGSPASPSPSGGSGGTTGQSGGGGIPPAVLLIGLGALAVVLAGALAFAAARWQARRVEEDAGGTGGPAGGPGAGGGPAGGGPAGAAGAGASRRKATSSGNRKIPPGS
jgi:hypothetical protein